MGKKKQRLEIIGKDGFLYRATSTEGEEIIFFADCNIQNALDLAETYFCEDTINFVKSVEQLSPHLRMVK